MVKSGLTKMIKAIVFDIGGVLVENVNHKEFWQDRKGAEELRQRFGSGKLSMKNFVKSASKILELSENEFINKYKRVYSDINLNKEIFKIYKKIKINKYILSDTNPIHTYFLRKKFPEIFKISKKVFMSHKIRFRKKEQETFKFLIEKLGEAPEEIVFVDDKKEVIKIAKKLGIKTILFKNNKQLVRDLRKLGVEVK